jgi:glycine dehydrogenase subunit 2
MLIFELSQTGRIAKAQIPVNLKPENKSSIPENLLRKTEPLLPQVSELQVVRHFTRLSQKNFSIDTHFYPLGSCTMKYNPRGVHRLASLPNFLNQHPLIT